MKTTRNFAALIAAAMAVGIILTACDNGTDGGSLPPEPEAETKTPFLKQEVLPGETLEEALDALLALTEPEAEKALEDLTDYRIDLSAFEGERIAISKRDFTFSGIKTVAVTLFNGGTTVKTITPAKSGDEWTEAEKGSLFTVGEGVILTLDGITLDGLNEAADGADNNAALVTVNSGGVLRMTGQARITGNTNRQTGERVNAQGGGIALIGASLVMRDDAKIDRNMTIASGLYSSTLGGGIYANNSAVELTGNAVVTGNTAGSAPQNYYSEGGGIYSTTSGTVILRENAVVRGNIAGVEGTYTHGQALGGGICAVNGVSVLVEDSAKVENNSALAAGYSEGGGIYINIAYLRLRGDAHVRGNLARGGDSSDTGTSTLYACGGGIFTKTGVFDMDGGHISGNIAQGGNYTGVYTSRNIYAHGGGVFIMQASNMYMTGGEITGNFARAGTITQEAAGAQRTATSASESAGGGIYLESPLYMSGGVISANTAGTPAGAGYGYGSAILCGDSPAQLYISGTASIPAQTDSTDDTDDKEDSRNTVAAKFYSTTAKGTTNHQNAPVLFMGELTGSEPIIIDIVSKDALPSGTVEKFIDEGGRILFWQSSALVYPPLPGRFTLGRFVELNSTISSADYYQFKSTDISSTHEIGADGRIKQQ